MKGCVIASSRLKFIWILLVWNLSRMPPSTAAPLDSILDPVPGSRIPCSVTRGSAPSVLVANRARW